MNIKNNKGYTLILVIIIFAVLFILGTLVLKVTMASLKTSKTITNGYTDFYTAKFGLEEAYHAIIKLNQGTDSESGAISTAQEKDTIEDAKKAYINYFKNNLEGKCSSIIDIVKEDKPLDLTYSFDETDPTKLKILFNSKFGNSEVNETIVIKAPKFSVGKILYKVKVKYKVPWWLQWLIPNNKKINRYFTQAQLDNHSNLYPYIPGFWRWLYGNKNAYEDYDVIDTKNEGISIEGIEMTTENWTRIK